ncbi:MAG: DUF4446 family protein [Clostridia bacterium]|nr:DUF4446 family protein [Clostridia bacterium]
MDFIFKVIQENWQLVLLLYSFIILLLIFLAVSNSITCSIYKKKYKKLMRGLDNKNLEVLLNNQLDRIDEFQKKLSVSELKLNVIERDMDTCIQKIGIVRYDAFNDIGSELSFSIALLDNSNSGLILTGLRTRNSSTLYAKPVKYGKSEYPLSEEELKAIADALNLEI